MTRDQDLVDYLREISVFPLLSAEEEMAVAERTREGDEGARRTLILSNLRLVIAIAKKYTSAELTFLELVTEGNFGLIRAADHYRPDKETRFATYASWWIKQAITQALKAKNRPVRIPRHILRQITVWNATARDLEQKYARKPTSVEIASAINLPVSRVPSILQVIAAQKTISHDNTDENGNQDEIAASARRTVSTVRTHEMFDFDDADTRKMLQLIRCVDARAAMIIRGRYGLDGAKKLTLEEAGAMLPGPSLTRERVRQIETEALRKILKVLQPKS